MIYLVTSSAWKKRTKIVTICRRRKEEYKILLRALQMRKEDAELAYNTGLQCALAKAVRRIRWTYHGDCLIYHVGKLFKTLRARIFLGLLHFCIRLYTEAVCIGAVRRIGKHQHFFLRKVIDRWAILGFCEVGYHGLLRVHLANIRKELRPVTITAEDLQAHPGFNLVSTAQRSIPQIGLWNRIPNPVKVAPLHKNICWECGSGNCDSKLKTCASCKIARYCSVECQQRAWAGHAQDCPKLFRFLTKGLLKEANLDTIPQGVTWGTLLWQLLGEREEEHRRGSYTSAASATEAGSTS